MEDGLGLTEKEKPERSGRHVIADNFMQCNLVHVTNPARDPPFRRTGLVDESQTPLFVLTSTSNFPSLKCLQSTPSSSIRQPIRVLASVEDVTESRESQERKVVRSPSTPSSGSFPPFFPRLSLMAAESG
jgi:hypothetical protein